MSSTSERVAGCDFCEPTDEMMRRMIRDERNGGLGYSIVSRPAFRPFHVLVIPAGHAADLHELRAAREQWEFVGEEIARLALALANLEGSAGYQRMQKSLRPGKGAEFSRTHYHEHVVPFMEDEEGTFVMPNPNTPEGFYYPTDDEIQKIVNVLRYERS